MLKLRHACMKLAPVSSSLDSCTPTKFNGSFSWRGKKKQKLMVPESTPCICLAVLLTPPPHYNDNDHFQDAFVSHLPSWPGALTPHSQANWKGWCHNTICSKTDSNKMQTAKRKAQFMLRDFTCAGCFLVQRIQYREAHGYYGYFKLLYTSKPAGSTWTDFQIWCLTHVKSSLCHEPLALVPMQRITLATYLSRLPVLCPNTIYP